MYTLCILIGENYHINTSPDWGSLILGHDITDEIKAIVDKDGHYDQENMMIVKEGIWSVNGE